MMRFRVVKGGTLLLILSVAILAAVICIIAISYYSGNEASDASATGAEVLTTFASTGALELEPAREMTENEHTDATVDVDVVTEKLPVKNGMRVLIYHTHTHEAYAMAYEGEYTALEAWRTDDNEHNIVRVGDELTALLEQRGFTVVHDITDHEKDDLSTAYLRSMETLDSYADQEFDLYIDMHRDAYTDGAQLTCAYRGDNAAKLMMLIGKGENFSEKPYYAENYALARTLTDDINSVCPGLCRDVLVKTGRYNQHVAPNSILVEVGNNMNTLDEALSAMPALALAIAETLTDDADDGIITVNLD